MTPTLRKLSIALAISVGLNLFLGGFVVARALMRHHPHGAHGAMPAPHGMGPHPLAGPMGMLHDLEDPNLRKAAERLFESRREHFERERARMVEARRNVAAALGREPHDPQALQAAFAALREVTTATQAELHAALIELAPTLSPQQRQKLVKKWARGPRRGGPDPD